MTPDARQEKAVGAYPYQIRPAARASVPVSGDAATIVVAEIILRNYAARSITMLTGSRSAETSRQPALRLSANDCYVALDEACRKMARVAVRRQRGSLAPQGGWDAESVAALFPDPAAYLARAIKSVISDEARTARRDVPTVSIEQPLGADNGEGVLRLSDTLRETAVRKMPAEALADSDERARFRYSLKHALDGIPGNYLAALRRDIARERERETGTEVGADSARDRQTLHRARAALAQVIRTECGDDNPFVHLVMQRRNGRVRQKPQPSAAWSGERQEVLFRRLMETRWSDRAMERADGSVDEAVINDVSAAGVVAPPSPELRQAMRVLDLYTVDRPTPKTPMARDLYERAQALRQAGKTEDALKHYRACFEAEPTFVEAENEVGVMLSQLGNLRDALKVYLGIVERRRNDDHALIAATNAADIYLTWYDSGRNRERNIELAAKYAQLAMRKPTPMRACNLLLAYAKDRYFDEARKVLDGVLKANAPECPSERFLQTLFQIRDKDLVSWWNWLDETMQKEEEGRL